MSKRCFRKRSSSNRRDAKKVEAFGNKTKEIGNGLTKNVTAPIAGLEVAAVSR